MSATSCAGQPVGSDLLPMDRWNSAQPAFIDRIERIDLARFV
jgi:hypothetical protein